MSSSSDYSTFAIDTLESLSNQLDHLSFSNRTANRATNDASNSVSIQSTSSPAKQDVDLDAILDFDFLQLSKKRSRSSHTKNANYLPDIQTLKSSLDQLIQEKSRLFTSNVESDPSSSSRDADLIPLARIIYSTLSLTIETLLNQAEKVQDQAFYWTRVEDSSKNTLIYLVQTLPPRFYSLLKASVSLTTQTTKTSISQTSESLSKNKIPTLDRETIRKILRLLKDSPLFVVGTLFPEAIPSNNQSHLRLQNVADTESDLDANEGVKEKTTSPTSKRKDGSSFLLPGIPILRFPSSESFSFFKLSPMRLTRHEARIKRSKVLKKRDELAEMLGEIAMASTTLSRDEDEEEGEVKEKGTEETRMGIYDEKKDNEKKLKELKSDLKTKLDSIEKVLKVFSGSVSEEELESSSIGEGNADASSISTTELTIKLQSILSSTLPTQISTLKASFSPSPSGLSPPTFLIRIWPNLILVPLGSLITLRLILSNWDSVLESLNSTKETISGFFTNWLYEPVLNLIQTVRTGTDEEGMIVSRESLKSDLESLQRMVIDFGVERNGLNANGSEVEELKRKVKEGDLSSVMMVYEGEMKSPVSSLIKGSLLRSLLIQIQKSKVDIELAMSGIDKLLKSQQLLFGAVGIAPAMVILWGIKNGFGRLIWGKYEGSGEEKRMGWEAMRRIDRLLSSPSPSPSLSAKSYGLLLLDLSLLRRISLPLLRIHPSLSRLGGKDAKRVAKRLRELWIEDLKELEKVAGDVEKGGRKAGVENVGIGNKGLGIGYLKRRAAVERMWNSWGSVLSL